MAKTKQPICKFCKQPQPDFAELQLHCEIEHSNEYKQIAKWLGRTTEPKLKVLEAVAKEGLIGYTYRQTEAKR
jgi:hypothetical protein